VDLVDYKKAKEAFFGNDQTMTSYFYRDWKAVSIEFVPEIPSNFLNYDPINFRNGGHSGPEGWKVVLDESNQSIELCSSTMFPLSGFLLSAGIGVLFVVVIVTPFHHVAMHIEQSPRIRLTLSDRMR
jgi:hypothetical protein